MGVSKNRGKTSKMDGLFHGKPYEQMDDLGGVPPIFGSTPILRELTWCDRPPWAKERSVQSTIMITRGLIMLACI